MAAIPYLQGRPMKNPVAMFTSVAVVAAAVLGTTLFLKQPAPAPTVVTPAKVVEAPAVAVPAAEPKQAKVAPVAETPATPVAEKTTEVAMVPAEQAPAESAPAAPVVVTPAAPVAVLPKPAPVEPVAATPAPAPTQPVATLPAAETPSLPSFDTVRVETTGDAIIAGRAEANAVVTVKWNGNIVGTTTANADGSFVLVPANPLKTGIGAMTIEMNKDGKVLISEGSVFVVVKKNAPAMIAKVDPVAPTEIIQSGAAPQVARDLQLTAVDYDTTGNIVFSGTAAPGSMVRFYVDNAATGEGLADPSGKWRFSGTSAVSPGTHMLRADAVDGSGKVQSRIELPFLRESPETVAAAQVVAAPQPVAAPAVAETPAAPVVVTAPAVEPPEVATAVAAAEQPVATRAVEEGPRKLVIQPGNSLWKLSREVYGKGRMYTVIYEANKELVKNPNRIYPGQILTAPKQN